MGMITQFITSSGFVKNTDTSDTIESWTDTIGDIKVQELTKINQMDFLAASHNGHNVFDCTNNESLTALNTTDLEKGTDNFSLVTVMLSTGGNGRIHGKGVAGSTAEQYVQFANGGTNKFHGKVADGTNRRDHTGASANIDFINANVIITTFNSSTDILTHYVNGVLENSTTADIGATVGDISAAAKKYAIGQMSDEGNFITGGLLQIQHHDDVISDPIGLSASLAAFYAVPPPTDEIIGGVGRTSFRLDQNRQTRYNRGVLRFKRR